MKTNESREVSTHLFCKLFFFLDLPKSNNRKDCSTYSNENEVMNKDKNKEGILISIIVILCVIVIILLTTLCVINFHTRRYLCCTVAGTNTSKQYVQTRNSHDQNDKLHSEISV